MPGPTKVPQTQSLTAVERDVRTVREATTILDSYDSLGLSSQFAGELLKEGLRDRVLVTQADSLRDILSKFRGDKNRYQDQPTFDDQKQVKIGLTVLDVPPQSIVVREQRENDEIPMLRARGSALVKSGRGRIVIEMSAIFPDTESVNTNLRELVAQFKASPFLTVESSLITAAVLGFGDNGTTSDEKVAQVQQSLEGYRDVLYSKTREARTSARELLFSVLLKDTSTAVRNAVADSLNAASTSDDDIKASILRATASDLSVTARQIMSEHNDMLTLRPEKFVDYRQAEELLNTEVSLLTEVLKAEEMEAGTISSVTARSSPVPVVLQSITMSNISETDSAVRADIVLQYFNFLPLAPTFSYVDNDGTPVSGVSKSGVYQSYVNGLLERQYPSGSHDQYRMFFGKVSDNPDESGSMHITYPTSKFISVDSLSSNQKTVYTKAGLLVGMDNNTNQPSRSQKVPLLRTISIGPKAKEAGVEHIDNAVLVDVAVHLQNRIAAQPVQSSPYYSAQYMGAENARIHARIKVTHPDFTELDRRVGRIHDMKRSIEQVFLTLNSRQRRNSRIFLDLDLAKLAGVHQVQLDNVTTESVPDEVDSVIVTLEFVEFSVSQDNREQIIQKIPGASHTRASDVIKQGLEYHFRKDNLTNPVTQLLFGPSNDHRYRSGILTREQAEDYSKTETDGFFISVPQGLVDKRTGSLVAGSKRSNEISSLATNLLNDIVTRKKEAPAGFIDFVAKNLNGSQADLVNKLHEQLYKDEKSYRERFLASQREATGQTAYPDMDLPTYSQLLKPIEDQLKDTTTGLVDSGLRDLFTDNNLQESLLLKSVVTQIMPTYQDLGIRPPFGALNSDPARELDDFVDPDFYFNKVRVQTKLRQLARETLIDDGLATIGNGRTIPRDVSKNVELAEDLSSTEYAVTTSWSSDSGREKDRKKFQRPPHKESGLELKYYGVSDKHKPSKRADMLSTYGYGHKQSDLYRAVALENSEHIIADIYSETHQRMMVEEAYDRRREDTTRLVQAFPTFRLEFIERDSEQWALFDDFYGYNSVLEFEHIRDKYIPDLLRMKLLNISGNLDRERFVNLSGSLDRESRVHPHLSDTLDDPQVKEANNLPPSQRNARLKELGVDPVTFEKEHLDAFLLEPGTNIRLRIGYTSKVEEMEIVFTGQIADIQLGDVIEFTAQSYKSQLMVPLNAHLGGSESDHLDVINYVLSESPTEHFGSPNTLQYLAALKNKQLGNRFFSPAAGGLSNDISLTPVVPTAQDRRETVELLGRFFSRNKQKIIDTSAGRSAKPLFLPDSVNRNILDEALIDNGLFSDVISSALGLAEINIDKNLRPHLIRALTTSRKLGNVFLPRHNSFWEVMGTWTREWLIPNITGWEVLHELTRHMPGYVCDVRPYDTGATLFFGRPEQPYFFTDEKQKDEEHWRAMVEPISSDIDLDINRVLGTYYTTPFYTSRSTGWWSYTDVSAKRRKLSATHSLHAIEESIGGDSVVQLVSQFVDQVLSRIVLDNLDFYHKGPTELNQKARIEVTHELNKMRRDLRDLEASPEEEGVFYSYQNALRFRRDRIAFLEQKLKLIDQGFVTGVGYLLSQMPNAYSIIRQLAALDANASPETARSVMEGSSDFFDSGTSGILLRNGESAGRDDLEQLRQVMGHNHYLLQAFLVTFSNYLQSQHADRHGDRIDRLRTRQETLSELRLNPRMKPFRDYHTVDSNHHIISNKMTASKEFMSNQVVVQWSENWSGGTSSDDLQGVYMVEPGSMKGIQRVGISKFLEPQDVRVRWVAEPNAETTTQAWLCGFSNLAEALRPMYRGHLHLRGNERIKPHDIVYVVDHYNAVQGPVEAERVIHHFSFETGFATTVVPQLVTIPNNSISSGTLVMNGINAALGSLFGFSPDSGYVGAGGSALGISTGSGALLGLLALATPAGAVVGGLLGLAGVLGYNAMKGTDATEAESGTGFWGNVFGQGQWGETELPVKIVPLTRNGYPWTAGLRGIPDKSYKYHMDKGWKDFDRAKKIINNMLDHVSQDNPDASPKGANG